MRRLLPTLGMVGLLGVATAAYSYLAFEQITIANTAIGFTVSKIAPSATSGATGTQQATQAICRLETAEIRYTIDGTTPTTTVGTLLEPQELLTVTGPDVLRKFSAIRTGATSGQLDCTYTQP